MAKPEKTQRELESTKERKRGERDRGESKREIKREL